MNQPSSEKSNTVRDGRAVSSFLNDNQPPKLFIKKILLKIDQMISPSRDNPSDCPHVLVHCIIWEIKGWVWSWQSNPTKKKTFFCCR